MELKSNIVDDSAITMRIIRLTVRTGHTAAAARDVEGDEKRWEVLDRIAENVGFERSRTFADFTIPDIHTTSSNICRSRSENRAK